MAQKFTFLVNINSKEELKVNTLLSEFKEIRNEVRSFETLEIVCIALAALTFVILLIAAVLSKQYILLLLSPLLSLFFVLLATGMFAHTTNLGLRASQIEDKLNKILGERIIEWEA